jgi:glycosyltransferase involved in cell wall biosynthesis
MKPLISVITVCLNAATFIEQTIQSVLAQTYPKIEYIIIDGGSTDGTVDIIRKYESRLAYWHSKPDRGLAQAFNLGLVQAKGAWILFLNADDFFLNPTVLDEMAPYLAAHPEADVIYGDTVIMSFASEPKPMPFRRGQSASWSWQKLRWLGMFGTIPHQSAFTSRRYFARVGNFAEGLKISVDYEHYLRGGRNLRVLHVRLPVSGMRVGGLAARNIIQTFRECRWGQQQTGALPPPLAWLSFFYMVGRYYLSRMLHRILDPLYSRVA